ncbi:putative tyrosinase-like protein tyr-3 [Mya arenaria]|uniref:putative tyrosinase-like protein tyr-3 n=1 Tax=Mya arenaria TaxID=6604 RepID=UPI0022DF290C|nr:putative tyrosinase-like protein tyr-3 [Mya arenaria]
MLKLKFAFEFRAPLMTAMPGQSFEEELRREDATVSIPYWDSSLDFDMDNGVNSVLWSAELLGNGNGDVITGPFAGWMSGRGILGRMYGDRGRLISDEKIQLMTSVCQTDNLHNLLELHVDNEVVFPQVDPDNREERDHIIEYHHNGVHNWVGGDMADGSYAAYDPVFYMHHAFIDFIWEKFRRHQSSTCQINPENAYATRTGGSGHGPNDLMYGFTFFKNIEGLKNVWTEKWYNYEELPQCPNCGSKYLYCNTTTNRCVSHSRRTDFNVGKFMSSPEALTFGMVNELVEPLTNKIPRRIISPFMPSPNPDGRFHGTAKEDALNAVNIQESPLQPPSSVNIARSFPFNSWVENLEQASGGTPSSRSGRRRRRKFISLF